MKKQEEQVARISDAAGGYVITDDSLDYIDERGTRYSSRRAAIQGARHWGYTHYLNPSGRKVRLA